MNFEEARKALIEGEKIRRREWQKNEFIYLDKNLIICAETKVPVKPYDLFFNRDDEYWELYKEPVKPFKTQLLEWFTPADKMPERKQTIIFKQSGEGLYAFIIKQGFDPEREILNTDVEAWAYWEY